MKTLVSHSMLLALVGCFAMVVGCVPSSTDNSRIRFEEGISVKQFNPQRARELFEMAVHEDPNYAKAHLELALLYEEKSMKDPVAALYHLNRYLELDPESPLKETVIEPRIRNNVHDISTDGAFQLIAQQLESDLMKKDLKIEELEAEIRRLEKILKDAQAAMVRQQPPSLGDRQVPNIPPLGQSTNGSDSALFFEHVVEPQQYPYAIARMYDVKVQEILDANPGIDPRSLQIGQVLRIPKR